MRSNHLLSMLLFAVLGVILVGLEVGRSEPVFASQTATQNASAAIQVPPTAVVAVDKLNLREGPGREYRSIGMLKRGDVLTITGRSQDNKWIEVVTSTGKKGWCSAESQYVKLNTSLEKIAVASQIPPKPTIAAPRETEYVMYFYFAPEGCPFCRRMTPNVQRYYEEYGQVASHQDRAFGLASLAPPSVQEPRRTKVDVFGVPIYHWGTDVAGFKRATGATFPIVGNPGLSVDTSTHPVTVMYNRTTNVYRVATRGVVPYETLVRQANAFVDGTPIAPVTNMGST